MQKIVPFLWFNDNAEEAVNFYVSVFKDSKILNMARYGAFGPGPEGSVMTAVFVIEGQEFMALNGGPVFKFSQAISFMVNCAEQEEVDALWDALSEGGEIQECGWVIDKFGVTWQIVPTILGKLIGGPDPEKSGRAMEAMLKMKKLDGNVLQKAYDGIL